jgi:hypothetical protein
MPLTQRAKIACFINTYWQYLDLQHGPANLSWRDTGWSRRRLLQRWGQKVQHNLHQWLSPIEHEKGFPRAIIQYLAGQTDRTGGAHRLVLLQHKNAAKPLVDKQTLLELNRNCVIYAILSLFTSVYCITDLGTRDLDVEFFLPLLQEIHHHLQTRFTRPLICLLSHHPCAACSCLHACDWKNISVLSRPRRRLCITIKCHEGMCKTTPYDSRLNRWRTSARKSTHDFTFG